MRVLLFDPFHGAAGDMIVGSLLDMGADENMVRNAMASVAGEPKFTRVKRGGIEGVLVESNAEMEPRSIKEVLERLRDAEASPHAKEIAERIFHRMHHAEERIHGEAPHFHEIGSDDAIAEVTGACVAVESLEVGSCTSLPLVLGSGYAESAHGRIPVPAPATLEIIRGSNLLIRNWEGQGELCTPTGAAILAELCRTGMDIPPHAKVIGVGYGAGSRDTPDGPNVLRAVMLEVKGEPGHDMVDLLETNIDDVTPEVVSHAIDRTMAEGALDATVIPALMKKGRPGHLIRVISPMQRSGHLAAVLAKELGTLGIRVFPAVHRFVATRRIESVEVRIGGEKRQIDVKFSYWGDQLISMKPEFEQCRAWAEHLGLPVRDVLVQVEEAGRDALGRGDDRP
ncbi:MAG: nickel pincer cofactor biosynthesis protein LarC [Methanomicrobiales archaeon]|nr:nickel pincer cofactor biosynthesis protein LarC [Methanomicrobiales archaeon]